MSRQFRGEHLPDWVLEPNYEHEIIPVGYVFQKSKVVPGPSESEQYQRLSLTMNGVLPRSREATDGLQPENFDGYQLIKPGQLIFKLIDLQNVSTSRVGLSEDLGLVSPAYIALTANRRVLPKYAYWYFMDLYNRRIFNNLSEGGVRANLSWEGLRQLPFILPSIERQRHIVEFLDAELGRIDTLQTGLQRLADLVEERRLARLTSSFSSFDAAEKMKLKWILKKRSEEATPGSGTVTAFRDGQVTLRELRREDGYTFSETEDGYQVVHQGDLVFHGLDGFAGAVGIAEEGGNCSPVYHVCSLRSPNYDLTFIAKYLRYLGLSGYLATEAPNVRQRSVDFRNWDRFSNLLLPFPRLEEQRRILASLSADLEQDESFVQQVTQVQEILKERRTALITAAVTGELEV